MSAIQLRISPSGGGSAYILAQSPARSGTGAPIGPDHLDYRHACGTIEREPIGAQGIETEPIGGDRRTLSFSVKRTYASNALALAGLATIADDCPKKGAITLDNQTLIAAATLIALSSRLRGRELSLVYSFEGY